MFERAILHLDLDAFFVSVECLRNSSLSGIPLIIGGRGQRSVVASCSYEARRYGVHSAMPLQMALRLCPDAVVVHGDMDVYSRYSKLVTEIIASEAPAYEKASIDEFYLDLSGMDRYLGCWKWSGELRQKIMRESGLPISFGLSVNKLVSKVGTGEAKPNGAKMIVKGSEKHFLAPLSVKKLPAVGDATYKKLSFMGVRTVDTLSKIPPALLQREFGKQGLSLWNKANAIDESPVTPYSERKSLSTERTFQIDTTDVDWLKDGLAAMVTKLAYDLRRSGKLTSCVTVKLRYADFNTFSRQQIIPYTANDLELIRCARSLFDRLYERRQLVRLVGVKFSHLVEGSPQLDLFQDTLSDNRLLRVMDQVRDRFGNTALTRASLLDGDN